MLSYGCHLQSLRNQKIFVIYYDKYVYIDYIQIFVEIMVMILLSRLNRYIELL